VRLKAVSNQPRTVRQIVHQFENLVEAGPEALPVIRAFLRLNQEREYETGSMRGYRDGKVPSDFTVPPSLRLGLLEVVKNIGGEEAEKLLADVLGGTGRGIEVAYLARALQELAPGKHRELALSTARDLLNKPLVPKSSSGLDQYDGAYLYGVLTMFNDSSFAAQVQPKLVQPDGRIDRVALKYVQQAMGELSLPIAAQLWQDTRIPPDQKEPLARVALTYVGANDQAVPFYLMAINDPNLSREQRKNLIEDLNEEGFPDPKKVTANDLPLIQKRLDLIEQAAPNAMDEANAAAFKEAYKDLVNMRDGILHPPTPGTTPGR